jgi:hypothetical protein
MPRLMVELNLVAGDWGAQIGWVSVDVHGAIPGLRLNHLPVFRTANTGIITFGMPLLQGEIPGSRYSGISFDTDEHRQHFLGELETVLRATHPDLFDGRARP